MNVGQLRKLIEGMSDDTPVVRPLLSGTYVVSGVQARSLAAWDNKLLTDDVGFRNSKQALVVE